MKTINSGQGNLLRKKESGFTLIETAIVLSIGGILLAALVTGLMQFMKDTKIKTTNERIAKINSLVREYLEANEALPCPANRTIDSNDPNYGISVPVVQCTNPASGPATGTVSTNNVRIGMVPTRQLGLPDEYGYDAWGTRFTYAVSETLVTTGTFDSRNGVIQIVDRNGASAITPAASGNFIIVSHGPDRKGGFVNRNSAAPGVICQSPIAPGQMDEENCDNDRMFRVSQTYMREDATAYYDDLASFMGVELPLEELPEGAVVAFDGACPDDWTEMRETNGRFIIGAGHYTHQSFPVPNPLTGYPNTQQGSGTWLTDTLPSSGLNQYINMPPYLVSRYCIHDIPRSAFGGTSSGGVRTLNGNYDFKSPITTNGSYLN